MLLCVQRLRGNGNLGEPYLGFGMNLKNTSFTVIYAVSGLLTGFLISWILLAQGNFLYGFWHDHAGIGEGIEEFGPQNQYRQGFADTTREERVRLFAAINQAIHNNGKGLEEIRYRSKSQAQPQTLLRRPEIVHLQDVARLVTQLKWAGAAIAFIWTGCCAWALVRKRPLPKLKHQLLGIGGFLLLLGLVVIVAGPVKVFNLLHIWIFPADNQWFFYYQESLMSTLMMAPSLFGWITVVWVPLALLCFLALHGIGAASFKLQAASK